MSSSYVSFSTPALRKLTHLPNYTTTTSFVEVLAAPNLPERRVVVIIQNKSDTAYLEVVFAATGSAGISIAPRETFSIDNYNGVVRLKSDTAGSIAHIAYGSV
jgi:uncharacterized protein (DUF111 family)